MNPPSCVRVFTDSDHLQHCRQRLQHVAPPVRALASVLALAGNEVRLQLLLLLAEEQLCVCDLADVLRMSISAVSQHLRKLKDGGVVSARKVGQTVFYTLNPKQLPVLRPLLDHLAPALPYSAQ